MRKWNMIIGVVIFICAMVLSYYHTVSMFERTGYIGNFAHIGTIMCELAFFLGGANVIWYKLRGEKVAASARFTFSFGLSIVLYSNITSDIAHGTALTYWFIPESVLVGGLIPLLLLMSELVIGRAWLKKSRTQKSQNTNSQTQTQTQIENSQLTNVNENNTNSHKEFENTKSQTQTEFETQNTNHKEFEDTNTQLTNSQNANSHITTNENNTYTNSHKDFETQTQNEQLTLEQTQKETEEKETLTKTQNIEDSHVDEIAQKLFEQQNKLPTIKNIQEEAGCTPWQARLARTKLKKLQTA